MIGVRIGQQGRGGLLPFSPEALDSPVRSGYKCLSAQGLKEFRHHIMKRQRDTGFMHREVAVLDFC